MYRTDLQLARQALPGGPSASELADRADMSIGQLTQIERGEIRPGPKTRAKLIRVLKLTPEAFDRFWLIARRAFLERELAKVMGELRPKRARA